jgi:hypothetical protein
VDGEWLGRPEWQGEEKKTWPRRSYEIQRAASAKAGTKCKTAGGVLRGIGDPVRGVFLKQVGHHAVFFFPGEIRAAKVE